MKALQLLRDGSFRQWRRLDELNPFHAVDERLRTDSSPLLLEPNR
jgi:hypothetical protein